MLYHKTFIKSINFYVYYAFVISPTQTTQKGAFCQLVYKKNAMYIVKS